MKNDLFSKFIVLQFMVVVVILLFVFTIGCEQNSSNNVIVSKPTAQKLTDAPIKIGFIAPLSGDAAIYGKPMVNGVALAINEINQLGGVNGRKVEVIYEDGKCAGKEAVTAYQKLAYQDKVTAIIGGSCSPETLAFCQLAQKDQMPTITPTSTAAKVTDCGSYVFRVIASDTQQGKKTAEYFIKNNYKKAAVIYVNNEYGVGITDVFRKEFEKLGGSVLLTESFEKDAKDFRTQLTKIKASKQDIIYVPAYYTEQAPILKQAKELGIKTQFFMAESFKDNAVFDLVSDEAEGVMLMALKQNTDSYAEEFKASYLKAYGEEPGIYADFTYDATKILLYAMQKSKLSPDSIREELEQTRFRGATGITVFDEKGDADKDYDLYVVRDREFVKMES